MPLQATSGAASQDAFGGNGVAVVPTYIEDIFSCFLYTGNGSTQTITNGIDLLGKGGLVWAKDRTGAFSNVFTDTTRGAYYGLTSNTDNGQYLNGTDVTAFNSNGFSLGNVVGDINANGDKNVSWSFRKQPKFFDIQSWSGSGSNRTISHALGAVPGCIIVKRTDTDGYAWAVYHRSLANTQYLTLNTTAAAATGATRWNSTTPTSTVFSLGTDATVNASGGTYVAYLFAHDAGGFGLTGSDNVISCGSFVGTGSDLSVNLGYEPQWLLVKRASSGTENWAVYDNMRGMFVNYDDNILFPNTSGAEVQVGRIAPTATGFNVTSGYPASGTTYIYIAIRRGPMKVPTTGTSVFSPNAAAGSAGDDVTTNFPVDMQIWKYRIGVTNNFVVDRLRGVSTDNSFTGQALFTNLTNAETTNSGSSLTWGSTGFRKPLASAGNDIFWNFRRAPSFMDVVCYTGTGSARTVSHNLAAVPELIIVKDRTDAYGWAVYSSATGNTSALFLETTAAPDTNIAYWNDTTPTSSVFSTGNANRINRNAENYVAYLFATCAGVSKCTSFTGNGTSQTINCGFTSGARFVMIKATSTTGNWTVFDSARGISAGGDPALYLNSTAAEVTGIDAIDADSTGFIVNQEGTFNLNASGVQYLVLAIA